MSDSEPSSKLIKNPYWRLAVFIAGYISLAVGFVGLFLPILPTTPFMILAAVCFLRSSPKLYQWLTQHPQFGHHIVAYLNGQGISKKAKILGLSTMWVSLLLTSLVIVNHLTLRIILLATGAVVSAYILSLPNWQQDKPTK